jgi:hypothetical protein
MKAWKGRQEVDHGRAGPAVSESTKAAQRTGVGPVAAR